MTASSIGALLMACGLRVTSIKIDPYLNTDAGTMSPFEHGEVFVLDDGGEVDLDLGNYERLLDIKLTRDNNITTGNIYQEQGTLEALIKLLQLQGVAKEPILDEWTKRAKICDTLQDPVRIAMVGKYTGLSDAYLSVLKALLHASVDCKKKLIVDWVAATHLEKATQKEAPEAHKKAWDLLKAANGILVPGGFGDRGVQGKILAAKYARENKVPYLGICLGMQTAVIEFARSVFNLPDANSTEFDPDTTAPCVIFMPEGSKTHMGGTMRLGSRRTYFEASNCKAAMLYGSVSFVDERHRHRYEVNPDMVPQLEKAGLSFVGKDETRKRMEINELPTHPYFVGVQFHPEFKSRPGKPSALFLDACRNDDGTLPRKFVRTRMSNFQKRVRIAKAPTEVPVKRARIAEGPAEDREGVRFLDQLEDEHVLSTLGKLCSSAQSPADFLSPLLTCKRLHRLGRYPEVLSQAGAKNLSVRANSWSKGGQEFLQQFVDCGNREAIYILGMIEYYARGNWENGLSLIEKAASKLHPDALYSLAIIQHNGSRGARTDSSRGMFSVALFVMAASRGHVDALREVGHFLRIGYGMRRQPFISCHLLIEADLREYGDSVWRERCPLVVSTSTTDSCPHFNDYINRSLPPLEPHPANRFLVEWFEARGGPVNKGLEVCAYPTCGRCEFRRRDFRMCNMCGLVKYCSIGCSVKDYKRLHRMHCDHGQDDL